MARTKSFTRRSRELPPNLQRTWQAHADKFVVPVARGDGYTTVAPDFRLDLGALFGRQCAVTVEIGSGTGEQAVHAAKANPDRDYLCFEVWVPGIAKLMSKALDAGVDNIRVIEADAQQAFPIIFDEATIAEVWTFFPDPWRKSRHHKRRLVSDDFAKDVARVLVDEGAWRLATDWDNYAWQMRDVIERADDFDNPYLGQRPDPADNDPMRGGFAPRWPGRLMTHFERRGIDQGRISHDIVGIRRPRHLAQ
ncbi:tRNA (guanosine(46)-N7)-methyltransferase TrmB [Schaalia suimastitidis]|uniref:tRNA (guanosine(46)-N7)-methyltransferase TrmB n=1 Tax=Schaalia suimastitidis TaxID=121163 RepID=UPI000558EF11|nr:tRNA (guanosine(46)-N7)-methyltransferase TrmB [Schaalia suimastitidis]